MNTTPDDPVSTPVQEAIASSLAAAERGHIAAIRFVRGGAAANLAYGIAAGLDVNAQDEAGMTALHHAAALAARPCIRVLVASGKCDYLIRDKQGRYASDLAIAWGKDYAVGRLLTKHQAMQAHTSGVPAWEKPDA